MLIGVVSDTHGYFDARLAPALTGVGLILHAGDVGGLHILDALMKIAPVVAVRGNNDDKVGGLGLPLTQDIDVAGEHLHLVHQLRQATPPNACRVVVFGHSHRALADWRQGVLYLNPGAAGRAGFHSTQTIALLAIGETGIDARIVDLGGRLPASARDRAGTSSASGLKGTPVPSGTSIRQV